jgi:hypothetical protein
VEQIAIRKHPSARHEGHRSGSCQAVESSGECSPESTPAPEGAPPESAPPESAPAPEQPSPTRGLLRKSAIRRFLKREFDFPLQIREAFFVAAEAKFSDGLRRSVARARELKRNTLMAPDA